MKSRIFKSLLVATLLPLAGGAYGSWASVSYNGGWSFTDNGGVSNFFETLTMTNPNGPGAGAITSYNPSSDSALVGSYIGNAAGGAIQLTLDEDPSSYVTGSYYSFDPTLYAAGFGIFDSGDQLLMQADIVATKLTIGTDTSTPSGMGSTFGLTLTNMQAGQGYSSGLSTVIDAFLGALDGTANFLFSVGDDLSIVIENYGSGQVIDTTYTGTASVVPVPAALPLFVSALGLLGLIGWRRRSN